MIRDMKTEDLNITKIAKRTGHDRKTVRKYINQKREPKYKTRQSKPGKLDPYKEYLKKETEKEEPISAVRLFEEIQKKGYTGGLTILQDYIRPLKSKKAVQAVYRFETKPGKQAQADWSEAARIRLDGRTRKLYCFNMVLGYSRTRYVEFTLKTDTATFIRCHLNAFHYFGGYPEEILYDNTKNVVIKRAIKASDSIWNPLYLDFTKHYGLVTRLCRVRRAQTKGKVENVVKYVKTNFLAGREFTSLDDINSQRLSWMKRVNSKIHGTTHEVPLKRLKEENLNPICGNSEYMIYLSYNRKVSRDCFVSYLSNRYSVPYKYAGREATLKAGSEKLQIHIDGEKVCCHDILAGKGRTSREKGHFKGLLKEILSEGRNVYGKRLPLYDFTPSVDVEKRPLDYYDRFEGGDGLE